jgi:hypothetical protein
MNNQNKGNNLNMINSNNIDSSFVDESMCNANFSDDD